jgi:hypothetical protein
MQLNNKIEFSYSDNGHHGKLPHRFLGKFQRLKYYMNNGKRA